MEFQVRKDVSLSESQGNRLVASADDEIARIPRDIPIDDDHVGVANIASCKPNVSCSCHRRGDIEGGGGLLDDPD